LLHSWGHAHPKQEIEQYSTQTEKKDDQKKRHLRVYGEIQEWEGNRAQTCKRKFFGGVFTSLKRKAVKFLSGVETFSPERLCHGRSDQGGKLSPKEGRFVVMQKKFWWNVMAVPPKRRELWLIWVRKVTGKGEPKKER